MSTLTPTRTSRAEAADPGLAPRTRVGSYVDSDRYQAPAGHAGSYVTSAA